MLKYYEEKIRHKRGLWNILNNLLWLSFDKILRVGVGLFVGVAVARYLGPEQYGLFNYSLSFVALFGIISTFGLNDIVVRDVLYYPDKSDEILGSAFLLHIIGGVISLFVIYVSVEFFQPNDASSKILIAVIGIGQLFKGSEVIRYWFEAKVQSKYTVIVENFIFILSSFLRVMLILIHASLIWFSVIVLMEIILSSVGLFFVYTKVGGKLHGWSINYEMVKSLIKSGWPLLFSGFVFSVYTKLDVLMLEKMKSNAEVGVYSAAVKISEIWYAIPLMIVSSTFPSLIEIRKSSEDAYYDRLQQLYDFLFFIALFLAVMITLFSNDIIVTLFGLQYASASEILSVYIWSGIFVFYGIAWSRWMINEGFQKILLIMEVMSLISNVILNYVLIPKYGALGAAIATTISYSLGHTLFALFFKDLKIQVKMFWRMFTFYKRFSKLLQYKI